MKPLVHSEGSLRARSHLWQAQNQAYKDAALGFGRLLLALVSLYLFMLVGILLFEQADLFAIARQMQRESFMAGLLPTWLLALWAPFSDGRFTRYLLAPLGGLSFVLLAAGLYVQDIYALQSFRQALHYVLSSLFAIFYPRLKIEGGKMQISEGKESLIDAVGGPGFVLIQPGNAVTFRELTGPSHASIAQPYFLRPFEKIGQIISLDDQHGHVEKVMCVTRDGIRMSLRDIHFRYKILAREDAGKPVLRSPEHPYPFSEQAMYDMAYNMTVEENGPTSWHRAVQKKVVGAITDYINEHNIDFLTAPRLAGQDPRAEIRVALFAPKLRSQLKALGAELLWVDIGHLDIDEGSVDEKRLNLWATPWIGSADTMRAYGKATRDAYQELGRAEIQAEMVMSITDALQNVNLDGEDPTNALQKMLLLRASQVLDAMHDGKAAPDGKTLSNDTWTRD